MYFLPSQSHDKTPFYKKDSETRSGGTCLSFQHLEAETGGSTVSSKKERVGREGNGLSLVSSYSCLHWEAAQNEYKDIEAILGGKCYLR